MVRTNVSAGALRDIVHLLVDLPPRQEPGERACFDGDVLLALRALIPSDVVVYQDMLPRQSLDWAFAETDPVEVEVVDDAEMTEIFYRHYWTSACAHPDVTGDFETVVVLTDLMSLREWRNCPMVVDLRTTSWGDGYFDRDLLIPLPGRPGHSRRIRFERRSGRNFDDTDRALAIMIRPLLVEYVHALDVVSQGIAPLTERQRQLMLFVAAGYTNTQVGRALGITAATVRTHLQQIYARLGVGSRGEATALINWTDGRALLREPIPSRLESAG